MSSSPTPSNTADVFERLAPQRQQIAYGLIAAGAALAAIPIANVSLYRWQSLAFFLWGAALSLFVLAVGVYYLSMEPAGTLRKEADRLRIFALVVLGGTGLLTALLGFALPFSAIPFSETDYRSIFSGGVGKWRERDNALALMRCGAALIGGMVVMFLGLLQARTFERTSPNLRRLLYGYNAVLSSLSLILIMVLVNMLPYAGVWPFNYANESIDWTRTGLHSLHDATRTVIADLKQPVKVYALGSSNDLVMKDLVDMLERCRNINPQQFSWEQLSRDRNSTALGELKLKYNIPDSEGVLVVYGSDKKAISEFIRYADLFKASTTRREPRYEFKAENALLNTITFLSADKSRAIVYFTQGNGELDFKDQRADTGGVGRLIEDLGRINYEARELPVAVNTDKIPEDANIVVVARPAQPFPEKFLTTLRDYLHGTNRKDGKKGKLIVLFDVVTERGKDVMVKTGLENLVAEYGVRVNDNQLVNLSSRDYLALKGIAPSSSNNPIAKAFNNEQEGVSSLFYFYKVRTLESSKRNPPGAPPSGGPENLIIAQRQQAILPQTDLSANAAALIAELERSPQKVLEKIARTSLPLAMTVSEGGTPAPPVPGHENMGTEGQPRLIVFGDAGWISNEYLLSPTPNNYQLFVSCLAWLAERPDIGARVPPTEHDIYVMKAAPGSELRLLLLPGVLMVMGVLALGVGVWVVRRR